MIYEYCLPSIVVLKASGVGIGVCWLERFEEGRLVSV